MKIIGTTRVTKGWKISLIKDVRDKLNAELGDKLVFYESDKGEIVLKKV
jgi:bifunctional DNA-binding transcriptional regulator/antitoxin component of YhaV-PrlF toxin-antitoxin module